MQMQPLLHCFQTSKSCHHAAEEIPFVSFESRSFPDSSIRGLNTMSVAGVHLSLGGLNHDIFLFS